MVRWGSELVARKRKRLVSMRTNRSFWLAPLLMLVCLGASIFAGYMAYSIEKRYSYQSTSSVSVVGICGGVLGVFAIFILIWAFVGDRSCGRIRCPKCWYDMSDTEGLKCPECGQTAKNTDQFLSVRRPKWAFVLTPMFLLLGGYGIAMNERVADNGYLAMMPNWVMLASWESLPESWLTTNPASLAYRIDDGLISRDAYLKLAEDIVDQMLVSKEYRWDPTRHLILQTVFQSHNSWYGGRPVHHEIWVPSENKLDHLLVASANDVIDAILAENPSLDELHILDLANTRYWYYEDIYSLSRSWILTAQKSSFYNLPISNRHTVIRPNHLNSFLHNALGELRIRAEQIDLIQILQNDDEQSKSRAIQLLIDTGAMRSYIDQLFELGLSVRIDKLEDITLCHAHAVAQSSDERKSAEFLMLAEMIENDDVNERAYVLKLLYPLSYLCSSEDELVRESRRTLIQRISEIAILDTRYPTTSRANIRIDQMANAMVSRFDAVGEFAFPILRANLLDDTLSLSTDDLYKWNNYILSDERIENWLLHFGNLVDSTDSKVRLWVIENLPEQTGTPFDEQLDRIVNQMMNDKDEDVVDEAVTKQGKRYSYRPNP